MEHNNAQLVTCVLQRLASWGVKEICIAAGARNIDLVRGVLASSKVRVWNFFEERSMAFFALGRAMTDRVPVAVITTSGTAAVELMPAIVEAYYQGIPLIAVTADRPRSYRGSGAPQAIEQVNLFGVYAPCYDLAHPPDVADMPDIVSSGPVQVNVCLEEGVGEQPAGRVFDINALRYSPIGEPHDVGRIDLVLAGGLSSTEGRAVSRVLARFAAPILAESTANLVGVDHLLLKNGERSVRQMDITRVLRIGSIPSWRWWRDLEERKDIEVVHYSRVPFTGLARDAGQLVRPLVDLECMSGTGGPLPSPVDVVQTDHFPLSEPAWMQHLRRALPEQSRVFLGNSLPIREWNLAVGNCEQLEVFACRGTNGIDGIVSAFLGVSVDARESWLIVGDLSALYDLAAPWIITQLPTANRRIVVINNGGGKIFSRVDSLRRLEDPARNLIENRHEQSFEAWAAMWKIGYLRATDPSHLEQLPEGPIVIEVVPDAQQTEDFWAGLKG